MTIQGDHWVDGEGRRLILRGVNLGGDAKVPVRPDGSTRLKAGFYDRRGVTFIGRPFPLDEADEHFTRLERWGLTFVRLLVTWEAVEHDGPGLYDTAYLAYLETIVARAMDHGITVFIDPHQDAWSRWTGGDGAPVWTLEAAGLVPEKLQRTGAAILHQELGDSYPRMAWIANYSRLACATMWTLFFAGDTYAPGIGPVAVATARLDPASLAPQERTSMQRFLQDRYIAAMAAVAARIERYPNVVGFDSLNEPNDGFIGTGDIRQPGGGMAVLGTVPSGWEAIRAGSGFPADAAVMGIRGLARVRTGTERLGQEGLSAWADGIGCIWRRAGVWDIEGGRPVLKRPGHFALPVAAAAGGFTAAFLKPFIARYALGIRATASGRDRRSGTKRFAVFVEGVPNAGRPAWKAGETENVVNAGHWYDDLTLVTKTWRGWLAFDVRRGRPVLGPAGVRRYFARAMGELGEWSRRCMDGCPTLLGEFGIPFDMNGARAYRTGDYRLQARALAANYDALDASLIDSTVWNYTAGNRHASGDLWNGEDLSVFCRDEWEAGRTETGEKADAGGRALAGFVRPYARATAGRVLAMRFRVSSGRFTLRYLPDHGIRAPTEIFVPELQYPRGFTVRVTGGEAEIVAPAPVNGHCGAVLVRPAPDAAEVTVELRRR